MLERTGLRGCHSHFYVPFIPTYVKGFFFQLFHYFAGRFFFKFLSISFSMKLNYFPNFKLILHFGKSKKNIQSQNIILDPKKNLIQVLTFEF